MRHLFPVGSGPAESEGVRLDEAYAYPTGRPWLRANMVATVDGAATGPDGLSGSVSGEADRQIFATLRSLADVVLVGAGTARREGYRPAALPIAVVSAALHVDLSTPLFSAAEHRTIVLTCASAPADRLAAARAVTDVVVCGDEEVDLPSAVAALHERGLTKILTEGGPTLLTSLIAAGLVDELCLTVSPYILGGVAGRILAGSLDAPYTAALSLLLEDSGWLFARFSLGHLAPVVQTK